ncbi:hypothetical protein [uncultured Sutterella sp.]|uniref:hypothetical protein n=1 Tax=uncultured Sutterella sp. TaxID=286133 RepID=UPI0025DE00F6|nr:hypothetical protein [uncultured Sutterella sp.]
MVEQELAEAIRDAVRHHPAVEAWDDRGVIVSLTTPAGPACLKLAEMAPAEETLSGYDLRTKTLVVWRFDQISDLQVIEP